VVFTQESEDHFEDIQKVRGQGSFGWKYVSFELNRALFACVNSQSKSETRAADIHENVYMYTRCIHM